MIFWTNKVNEVLFIKRNKLHLNNFYTYTNSIKKSIKSRLVFFYIFDENTHELSYEREISTLLLLLPTTNSSPSVI